jgi:hypothetical protein
MNKNVFLFVCLLAPSVATIANADQCSGYKGADIIIHNNTGKDIWVNGTDECGCYAPSRIGNVKIPAGETSKGLYAWVDTGCQNSSQGKKHSWTIINFYDKSFSSNPQPQPVAGYKFTDEENDTPNLVADCWSNYEPYMLTCTPKASGLPWSVDISIK